MIYSVFWPLVGFLAWLIPAIAVADDTPVQKPARFARIIEGFEVASPSSRAEPGKPAVEISVPIAGGADWLRLELVLEQALADPGIWMAEVLDAGNDPIQRIPARDMRVPRWTRQIFGQPVRLRVPQTGASVLVRRVMVHNEKTTTRSTIGVPNLRSILEETGNWRHQVSRGVVLVEYEESTGSDTEVYTCTGFMVSDLALVTNRHCISDDTVAKTARVYFDYVGKQRPPNYVRVSGLIDANPVLDVSVIELASSNAGKRALTLAEEDPSRNEPLRLIQQYEGKAQQESYDDQCRLQHMPERGPVVFENEDDLTDYEAAFAHGCDTDNRSSGSPLVSGVNGKVVGLHFWGKGKSTDLQYNKAIRSRRLTCWLKLLNEHFVDTFSGHHLPSNVVCP